MKKHTRATPAGVPRSRSKLTVPQRRALHHADTGVSASKAYPLVRERYLKLARLLTTPA